MPRCADTSASRRSEHLPSDIPAELGLPAISDSNAIRDGDRLLPQHQAALTLLQDRLSDPIIERFSWLDLACGQGQIILSLDSNLSSEARSKVEFCAYDLDQTYARVTERTAERLGFASLDVHVGDLAAFDQVLPPQQRFDFLTLTNVVHEIDPVTLAKVLIDCVGRLTDTGTLYVYDMERIAPPELGAIAWTGDEMRQIVRRMVRAFGASDYLPEVGRWPHRTCNAWNINLQRCHLGISRDLAHRQKEKALVDTHDEIVELLNRKLVDCRRELALLTKYGEETAGEKENTKRLLYDFWAISRALGGRP